jgi:hypothetical protein
LQVTSAKFQISADTPARIILQTFGLALAGLWIVIRTLVEYGRPAAGAGQALRIIGAERWLLAWSMSSWSAILYVMPHIFAFLRQGVDGALATFGCYLLFFALIAQVWVFCGGSLCTRSMLHSWTCEACMLYCCFTGAYCCFTAALLLLYF